MKIGSAISFLFILLKEPKQYCESKVSKHHRNMGKIDRVLFELFEKGNRRVTLPSPL